MERTLRLMCNTRNVENAAAFLDDAGYVPCFAVFTRTVLLHVQSRSSVSLDVEITYHHSQTQLFLKYNPYYYFKTSKLNLSSIDASRSNAKANRFPRQHHHP